MRCTVWGRSVCEIVRCMVCGRWVLELRGRVVGNDVGSDVKPKN